MVHVVMDTSCRIPPVALRLRSKGKIFFFMVFTRNIFYRGHGGHTSRQLASWRAKRMNNKLDSRGASNCTRVRLFLGMTLSCLTWLKAWRVFSELDINKTFVFVFVSSRADIYGNVWQPHLYLRDTGHKLWRSHTAWSASEAGTGLIHVQHSDPRWSQHSCWKHILRV